MPTSALAKDFEVLLGKDDVYAGDANRQRWRHGSAGLHPVVSDALGTAAILTGGSTRIPEINSEDRYARVQTGVVAAIVRQLLLWPFASGSLPASTSAKRAHGLHGSDGGVGVGGFVVTGASGCLVVPREPQGRVTPHSREPVEMAGADRRCGSRGRFTIFQCNTRAKTAGVNTATLLPQAHRWRSPAAPRA